MVVFVAGVHGVGKTYLCERFSAISGIQHASASSLIKNELKTSNWESNKLVSDIDSNQIALTAAVKRITESSKHLLLDGHFMLKKHDNNLAAVHEDIFKNLNLSLILLIESEAETIRQRLISRDSNASSGDIENFLQEEKSRAHYISKLLDISLIILRSPSEKEFNTHLHKAFGTN
ncbi:AAA family ATPase [Pseudomonas sp. MWU12-2534b]|nr:AAA family ATPase [Pseudomonas sp. MWU12-2534b]